MNKAINMLAIYHAEGADSANLEAHKSRILDYLWISEDGMKMQGYNGSQLWDTAFAVQAILETGLIDQFRECLTNAYHFLDVCQVREDVPQNDKYYRHISKGAWPFSTRDHGWPISDCTSKAFSSFSFSFFFSLFQARVSRRCCCFVKSALFCRHSTLIATLRPSMWFCRFKTREMVGGPRMS